MGAARVMRSAQTGWVDQIRRLATPATPAVKAACVRPSASVETAAEAPRTGESVHATNMRSTATHAGRVVGAGPPGAVIMAEMTVVTSVTVERRVAY